MFSSDVLAVASIAGSAALSVGATASLLDGPDRMSHHSACEVMVDDHFSNMTFSHDGGVIVVSPGNLQEIVLRADGDVEKCRRKRRRHRHRGDMERAQEMERAMERAERTRERVERTRERAERTRERAERVRVRAMEHRFEIENEALEEAARSLESVMEGEMHEQLEEAMRRMEVRIQRANGVVRR